MSNSCKYPKIPLWANVLFIAINAVPLLLSILHHWVTRAYFDSFFIPLVLATIMAGTLTYLLSSMLSSIWIEQDWTDSQLSKSSPDTRSTTPEKSPLTPDTFTGNNPVQLLQQLEALLAQLPEDVRQEACRTLLRAESNRTADSTVVAFDADPAADTAFMQQSAPQAAVTAEEAEDTAGTELQSILLAYVDRNCLDSSLCLNSAADYLNTSIYTISRIFKEATGVGFKEYITGKRLQYACHLLETTHKTVSVIATESGFENSTYFTTVFKNEYGIPPSKYRTNMKHTSEAVESEIVKS